MKKRSSESGMVTAEIAMGLIPIMGAFLLLMAAIALGNAALQAQEVARALARQAVIGKPITNMISQYEQDIPGSNIELGADGEYVVVTVSVEPNGVLTPFDMEVSSTVTGIPEPGVSLP
ncbi:MAG: hypothetical protein ACTHW1_11535 [Ancrocorticia sp.]|uniref:hypothetical protein n=1 Tax=Ancrocorticia sp. TaxID=2593684 RepID=UPI003F8FE444